MSKVDVGVQVDLLNRYAVAKQEWNRVMKGEASMAQLSQARGKLDACAQVLADAALQAWMDRR